MPKFKLTHQDNLEIIALYRQSWPVYAIVNKLAARSIDVTWGTVKHVTKRYQSGKTGYENLSKGEEKLPIFKYITDHNVKFVKNALAKKKLYSNVYRYSACFSRQG